jgi:hypothetical protein
MRHRKNTSLRPPPAPPQRTFNRRTDGELIVATGGSRTGKTSWVAQDVAGARRLLVWDSAQDGEWGRRFNCKRVESIAYLAEAVKPHAPDRRLGFVAPPTPENFAAFCRLAFVFIQVAPSCIVVEELADVTSPGKAPLWWGELLRKGLRYGPRIYACTQRPAESDKTIMGNASRIHAHMAQRADDAKYMAKELRVAVELVDALKPFQWIERDNRTHLISTGILRKSGRRP